MLTVPQEVLDLIKEREGYKTTVYRDTKGIPTAGTGHRLLPSELAQYPVGSIVPDALCAQWETQDTLKAYTAALSQAQQIGCEDPRLIDAICCAEFQIGTGLPHEFPTLWSLLMAHKWNEAADDAMHTLWERQTPARVADFVNAMKSLATGPSTPADAIT